MENRILNVDVRLQRLDPTEAEIWIVVAAEHSTPTTEIRGRFVGPKSRLASTIEVAYPLRPFSRPPEQLPPLSARVVIPEPSPYTPDSPFTYDAVIELWQDDRRCDAHQISGFKLQKSSRSSAS